MYKMKITEDMVTVFNQTLENLNCSFRLKYESGMCGNGQCKITPSNEMFIQSSIINLTEDFYRVLENFLLKEISNYLITMMVLYFGAKMDGKIL